MNNVSEVAENPISNNSIYKNSVDAIDIQKMSVHMFVSNIGLYCMLFVHVLRLNTLARLSIVMAKVTHLTLVRSIVICGIIWYWSLLLVR